MTGTFGHISAEAPRSKSTGRPRGRPSAGGTSGRERLLQAALRLFPRSGFVATTVEEMVNDANVTPPVLYHHFGTKAGLYVAAAEKTYQTVLDRHEAILAGAPTFAEALERLMQQAVDLRAEQPGLAPMMLTVVIDTQRDRDLAEQLHPTLRAFRRFFDRIAALASDDLCPTPAARRSLARALVTLMNGLEISALLARTPQDYTDTVLSLSLLLELGAQARGQTT